MENDIHGNALEDTQAFDFSELMEELDRSSSFEQPVSISGVTPERPIHVERAAEARMKAFEVSQQIESYRASGHPVPARLKDKESYYLEVAEQHQLAYLRESQPSRLRWLGGLFKRK